MEHRELVVREMLSQGGENSGDMERQESYVEGNVVGRYDYLGEEK